MAYRSILAAYDGSEQAIRALNTAMQLAQEWNAALTVVHAYQIPVPVMGEVLVTPSADTAAALSREADNTAEEVKSIIAAVPGLQAEVETMHGEPSRCILEAAKEKGADLIVIGSRGHGGLKEFVLGSVSHYVTQHARTAVLVVK